MMKVRFFGSSECEGCMAAFVLLNKLDIEYDYVDAMDDDDKIQNFCDIHKVEELPHLQFIDNDVVVLQHVGDIKEEDLIGYLVDYFPDY